MFHSIKNETHAFKAKVNELQPPGLRVASKFVFGLAEEKSSQNCKVIFCVESRIMKSRPLNDFANLCIVQSFLYWEQNLGK